MSPNIPAWFSIAATLLSGGAIAYLIRQVWNSYKLKRALKCEIQSMEGLVNCTNSMNSRRSPPSDKELGPSDVPPGGSIPTSIYEANLQRLGLLRQKDLRKIVGFYSDVLRYKSIMSSIRAGEDIPDPDQMDLYQSIGDLENRRQSLFGENWISEEGADEE